MGVHYRRVRESIRIIRQPAAVVGIYTTVNATPHDVTANGCVTAFFVTVGTSGTKSRLHSQEQWDPYLYKSMLTNSTAEFSSEYHFTQIIALYLCYRLGECSTL